MNPLDTAISLIHFNTKTYPFTQKHCDNLAFLIVMEALMINMVLIK